MPGIKQKASSRAKGKKTTKSVKDKFRNVLRGSAAPMERKGKTAYLGSKHGSLKYMK